MNEDKEAIQTFSEQQNASNSAFNVSAESALPERKPVPTSRVMRAFLFVIETLWTWIVVVITLFIVSITWLVTIREKKDLTDKNGRKNLLLVISE
jgi:hypothetical protein